MWVLQKSFIYMHIFLKVENQMSNAVFPIVLYPKPLPASIVRKVGVKPCAEMLLLKRNDYPQNQQVIK